MIGSLIRYLYANYKFMMCLMIQYVPSHDDVIKLEDFPRYWPFAKDSEFDVFFDVRLNKRLNKHLRRR